MVPITTCYAVAMDLDGLLNRPDRDKLRAQLPLSFVCVKLGISIDETGYAHCPFHDDSSPSFYLWEGDDGIQRWWCQPCGFGGDLFALIKRVRGVSYSESIDIAQEMFNEIPPGTDPPARRERVRRDIDPAQWASTINAAQAEAVKYPGALSVLTGLADEHDPDIVQWDAMLRGLGWGYHAGAVIMPHFNEESQLIGAKMRGIDGRRSSLPGSRYTHLYGGWLPQLQRETILLEGETDFAYAMYHAAKEDIPLNVLALPSGAGLLLPQWIHQIKNQKRIYLAFDPDDAGVTATRNWIGALDEAEYTGDLMICSLPKNQDLRAAQPKMRHLLDNARSPLMVPTDLDRNDAAGYGKYDAEGDRRSITYWTIEPKAQLIGGDPGFDIILHSRKTRRETQILLTDMMNVGNLRRWAAKHNEVFTGNDAHVQLIAKRVYAEGSITPVIYQTTMVGMHTPPPEYHFAGPSVVYPHNHHFGKVPWRYVPTGKSAVNVTDQMLIPGDGGQFDWTWLRAFWRLSSPEVTEPLLAWIVASFRRHEVQNFPLLFIGGSSGAGKSTLARLAMRLAGSNIEVDLGSATKFVLMTTVAATTTIPVFIDEWTMLSNQEARLAFKGFIPQIYAGGMAGRGQADLSVIYYDLKSPVMVAGEDTFVLQREQDRMVAVLPSAKAQNVRAFEKIQDAPLERFGQRFAEWIVNTDGSLPSMNRPAIDRPEHNRNVLLAGWETLQQYLDEVRVADPSAAIPDFPNVPNLSCFERSVEETRDNVYLKAVMQGLSLTDGSMRPLVWQGENGEGVYVRAESLIGALRKNSIDLDLPGGSRAMMAYFKEQYEVAHHRYLRMPPPFNVGVAAFQIKGLILEQEKNGP